MNYVYILVALSLIYVFLQPPGIIDRSSIYRGEPKPQNVERLRYFSYSLLCLFAFFCSVIDLKEFPSSEEVLAVLGSLILEFWLSTRNTSRVQTAVAPAGEHSKKVSLAKEGTEMPVLVPRKEEVESAERQRLHAIAESGRIDDVLALCVQNMRAGVKSQTFDIPRWLTLDEFLALRQKMLGKGWVVKYTFLSRYRDRPQLHIIPFNRWDEA
ncbi:MAG: hypothetical protein K2Y39_28060 [Candidatus Obscuribacterales bacterium]|nr:hypothetical protein [Candidatus Obscuribacterales bacterium]